MFVEKRDGSFQTLLSIAPTQDIETSRHLFLHDSTPSPLSTGSSAATGQRQSHHHHRKHRSRHHNNGSNVTTRDVGLQVNIQTVKKITFATQKSDESSLATTTSPSSPPTLKVPREFKTVETSTEPLVSKHDQGTSYESDVRLVTSAAQTLESPSTSTSASLTDRQTKAAQTPNKTLRDQSIETNNHGLFVCDLSSLLKNGADDTSSMLINKRKS